MKADVRPCWIYRLLYYNIMAENKKSFVLYSDQKSIVDMLTDAQAGKLLKHIFSYVNDENPKLEDLNIKLAFEPIKLQLKRDLHRWENTKLGRSKAGKASAQARKDKKEQKATNSTNVKSVQQIQQSSTNPTVNDNVNVNVTVNDILLEKETKELFRYWLEYRKEIKKPMKSEKSLIGLAKKIKLEGLEKSTLVINASIENGWQGLFWNKQQTEKEKNVAPKKESAWEIIKKVKNGTYEQ